VFIDETAITTNMVRVRGRCPRGEKVAGVEEAIEARGARVEYLLKYSPDLNPIELSFSKFKAYLRKFSERTIRTLYRRVGAFVPTLSRAECGNYFRHAGYVSI
jgi:transposase